MGIGAKINEGIANISGILKLNTTAVINYFKGFGTNMLILVVTILVLFFVVLINSFKRLSLLTNGIIVGLFSCVVFYVAQKKLTIEKEFRDATAGQ